jgi:hypothetical protein
VGWASGRDSEPSKLSVEQLVQTAVELCLDGTRHWDSTAVDLPGFLRGIIRSLTSSEKKKDVRAKTDAKPELDQYFEATDSPEIEAVEDEERRELLKTLEACTDDDADLKKLYLVILEGHTKRDDIAAALGWTADRVTAARIKLQRRLVRRAPEQFGEARERRRRIS